jgi:hypothetical protein
VTATIHASRAADTTEGTDHSRRLLATLLVLCLPLGAVGATTSLLAAPLWLGRRSDFRIAGGLQTILLMCVASGMALFVINPAGGSFSRGSAVGDLSLIARAGLTLGALLWCRKVLDISRIALLFGFAGLAKALAQYPPTLDPTTWKYHYSWWLILIVLAILGRHGRTKTLVALALIAVIASISEYRALFAFLAITILFMCASSALRRWMGKSAEPRVGALMLLWTTLITVVVAVYVMLQNLFLRGVFGSDLQAKTQLQLDQYGSIISGGRVEPPITARLMQANPLGYGPGYVPNTNDYYDGVYEKVHSSNLTYLNDYIFGGHIKLHSFWGDLWVNAGPVGLATAGVMAAVVLSALSASAASQRPQLLVVFLATWGGWHICFSPIYSNLLDFSLIAAVIAVPRRHEITPKTKERVARTTARGRRTG